MPIRGYQKALTTGEPELLFTASEGDLSVEVRTMQTSGFDDPGGNGMTTMVIGGPELQEDRSAGLVCTSGEWSSSASQQQNGPLAAGDEIWCLAPYPPRLSQGPGAKINVSVLVWYKTPRRISTAKEPVKP